MIFDDDVERLERRSKRISATSNISCGLLKTMVIITLFLIITKTHSYHIRCLPDQVKQILNFAKKYPHLLFKI